MEDLKNLTLPEITEFNKDTVDEIEIQGPLNYFVNINRASPIKIYRFFFMKELQKFSAIQKQIKIKAEGKEAIILNEKRKGRGKTFEMTDYYIQQKNSWKLILEKFQQSSDLLRVNNSLRNSFPKILKKDQPFVSNKRIFKLIGKLKIQIQKIHFDCVKISMEKLPGFNQKGIIIFYLDLKGNLMYKANYHPKSEYATVSPDHYIMVNRKKYGLLHCAIISSLVEKNSVAPS
ncbi:MAG: hypothetical protein APR63_11335 [Desulfuromonas sp. SDB]|nr:MAG: hypothetical protein APR63_11335 [Desulfuromonas sp. SDB]